MATLDPMPRDPVPESLTAYLKADETVQSVIGAQTNSTYLVGCLNALLWILTVQMLFYATGGSGGLGYLLTPLILFIILFVGDLAQSRVGGLTQGTYLLGIFMVAFSLPYILGFWISNTHLDVLPRFLWVAGTALFVLLLLFSLQRFRILAVTSQRILVLDTGRTNWKKVHAVVTELPSSTRWNAPSSVWWSAIPVGHKRLFVSRRFFKNLQPAALTK